MFAILLGSLLLFGAMSENDLAQARKRRAQFRYVASTDLGFNGVNTAKDDTDPLDPQNQVQSIDTAPSESCGAGDENTCEVGAITTRLGQGVKLRRLDGALSIRYMFIGRTCVAGAPRVQLSVDDDGDGASDGNAFGYLGDQAFGGDCPQTVWVSEDMTNNSPKWDAGQLGGGQTMTWEELEAYVGTDALVLSATLADDAPYTPTGSGCAYFDDFVVNDRLLDKHNDTTGSGADGSGLNKC